MRRSFACLNRQNTRTSASCLLLLLFLSSSPAKNASDWCFCFEKKREREGERFFVTAPDSRNWCNCGPASCFSRHDSQAVSLLWFGEQRKCGGWRDGVYFIVACCVMLQLNHCSSLLLLSFSRFFLRNQEPLTPRKVVFIVSSCVSSSSSHYPVVGSTEQRIKNISLCFCAVLRLLMLCLTRKWSPLEETHSESTASRSASSLQLSDRMYAHMQTLVQPLLLELHPYILPVADTDNFFNDLLLIHPRLIFPAQRFVYPGNRNDDAVIDVRMDDGGDTVTRDHHLSDPSWTSRIEEKRNESTSQWDKVNKRSPNDTL